MHASTSTSIDATETHGLGAFCFQHPEGTFSLTPSSLVALKAIFQNQRLLFGKGLDWGCGTGCLAIAAARINTVTRVLGLDISNENILAARRNAKENHVEMKVDFERSDSYFPLTPAGREKMGAYQGQAQFILSNPPSSRGDDGFEFRRRVLRDALPYLHPGSTVFLNISYQYGRKRLDDLTRQIRGYTHAGILAATDWVPFDLQRPDLLQCLVDYVKEERRGGYAYEFHHPHGSGETSAQTAEEAFSVYNKTGRSPYTQWQTHLFVFHGNE